MAQEVPKWLKEKIESGQVGYEPFYPKEFSNIFRVGENYYATDPHGNQFEFIVVQGRLVKRNQLTGKTVA
jgi:hypothetical protein